MSVFLALSVCQAVKAAQPRLRATALLVPRDVFSRGVSEWAQHVVLAELRRQSDLVTVDVEELFSSESWAQGQKAREEFASTVEQGFQAYQDLELERALSLLSAAQQMLPQAALVLEAEDSSLVERFFSLLGAVYLLRGEQQMGQQMFRQLLAMRPQVRLDDRLFPPWLVGIFQAVARDVEQSERGQLEIISVPANSRVYLDFYFACVTPCSLAELSAGYHLLVARKSGFASVSQAVEIEAGKNQIQLRLPELAAGCGLEQLVEQAVSIPQGTPLPEELAAWLTRANIDRVLLGVLSSAGANVTAHLRWWQMQDRVVAAETAFECSLRSEQTASRLQAAVSDLLQGKKDVLEWSGRFQVATGPLAGEELFGREPAPFWKSWWFWTAVGTAVAATAIALGVLLTRSEEPSGMFVLEF